MYPEDRVLVAVITRQRDLTYAREYHWYRVPVRQMAQGIETEYIAFFLSARLVESGKSGVHYYARLNGVELRYRYELIPEQVEHPRASDIYYRLAIGNLMPKQTPILNPEKRTFAFIYTTWDRFQSARKISDLYSDADHYVERLSRKLRHNGVESQQIWDAEHKKSVHAPGLLFHCKDGDFYLSAEGGENNLDLDTGEKEDVIFARIRSKIEAMGGLVMANLSPD